MNHKKRAQRRRIKARKSDTVSVVDVYVMGELRTLVKTGPRPKDWRLVWKGSVEP